MKPGTPYMCAICKCEFLKGWEDKEALKEYEINFPGRIQDDNEIICDDCYKEFINWFKKG